MNQNDSDTLREHYDFSGGVRGKHHKAYREGTKVVLLDPDVAEAFQDSAAVNQALRRYLSSPRPEDRSRRPLREDPRNAG